MNYEVQIWDQICRGALWLLKASVILTCIACVVAIAIPVVALTFGFI